jgi:hypothetical protein
VGILLGGLFDCEEFVVGQNNCSTMFHFQKQCGAAQDLLNTGRLHIAPQLHVFFNIIIIRYYLWGI